VLAREKLGFYFWELMIGKIQFNAMAGLIYPDGTTREPSALAALLPPGAMPRGFVKKEDGIPLAKPPDESALRAFLKSPDRWPALLERARQAPRTREGILPLVATLGALCRMKARPDPLAAEIFEAGLSLPHLFRLGKEAEALRVYESFLADVEKALAQRGSPTQ